MWRIDLETWQKRGVLRGRLFGGQQPVGYATVLDLWSESAEFRTFFNQALADIPLASFRWETPPLRRSSIQRPFEFVVWDSPELLTAADPTPFAAQLAAAGERDVVTFPNLGGDATLVTPCPGGEPSAYAHLAVLVRSAPPSQLDRVWQTLGEAMRIRVHESPIWLSTAGAGVAWVHFRIDTRPKYYRFESYRNGA